MPLSHQIIKQGKYEIIKMKDNDKRKIISHTKITTFISVNA
jgi:hypothetical protein